MTASRGYLCKKEWSNGFMGVVLAIAGVVALALLVYLSYVLFWGEKL